MDQNTDRIMRLPIFLLIAFSLTLPVSAQAADLTGQWQRSNGQVRIAFAPCPGGACGKITWLAGGGKGKARVGDRIFYDLVRDGDKGWKGKAYSPKEGKTYAATLTLTGTSLQSRECLFGGRICRSETWTRVN